MSKTSFSIVLALALVFPLGNATIHAQYYSSKPDFILTGMTVVPLQPAVNQPVKITVTGTYTGPARYNTEGLSSLKRDFSDLYYDGEKQQGAAFTVSASEPMTDGKGFSYIYYGSFASAGQKQLAFTVDYAGETDEVSEQNNRAQLTISVSDPIDAPNLSIQSITATPSAARVDQPITVEVIGRYTGSSSLLSDQGIRAIGWVMTDFVGSSGVTPVSPQPSEASPLSSGGTFKYTFAGSFSTNGIKTLTYTLDPLNELYESNEVDNTGSITYSIMDMAVSPGDENTAPEPPVQPETPTTPDTPSQSMTEAEAVRDRITRLGLTITDAERSVIADERAATGTLSASLLSRLVGNILLQVEELGRAWYLDPITKLRYYLKDGATAYQALQAFGLGISSADLKKIPVGIEKRATGTDSDSDGLIDALEQSLGTEPNDTDSDNDGTSDGDEVVVGRNPLGSGTVAIDTALTRRLEGRILLQVEGQGQAWYVHNGKRYYMPNGEQAYQIMRFLSLGITNKDLRMLSVGSFEN